MMKTWSLARNFWRTWWARDSRWWTSGWRSTRRRPTQSLLDLLKEGWRREPTHQWRKNPLNWLSLPINLNQVGLQQADWDWACGRADQQTVLAALPVHPGSQRGEPHHQDDHPGHHPGDRGGQRVHPRNVLLPWINRGQLAKPNSSIRLPAAGGRTSDYYKVGKDIFFGTSKCDHYLSGDWVVTWTLHVGDRRRQPSEKS